MRQKPRASVYWRNASVSEATSIGSPLGVDVPPMGLDQPLPGELPQPGIERHRPVAEVIVEPTRGVGERLLDDVRRVNAGVQPAVGW